MSVHGAVSMAMFLAQFTPVLDTCPFCGMRETLANMYLECTRLQPLFQLLLDILLHFWLHFSLHHLIYALPICGPTKLRDLLVNLLLALAKMANYKTRERRLADGVSCDCGAYFRSLSAHASRQSSSGQHPLSPLTPSRSSGRCLGFSARCPHQVPFI
ncbi:unnamed protein product [Natator depressus]